MPNFVRWLTSYGARHLVRVHISWYPKRYISDSQIDPFCPLFCTKLINHNLINETSCFSVFDTESNSTLTPSPRCVFIHLALPNVRRWASNALRRQSLLFSHIRSYCKCQTRSPQILVHRSAISTFLFIFIRPNLFVPRFLSLLHTIRILMRLLHTARSSCKLRQDKFEPRKML